MGLGLQGLWVSIKSISFPVGSSYKSAGEALGLFCYGQFQVVSRWDGGGQEVCHFS
jgi:hypothetical protein